MTNSSRPSLWISLLVILFVGIESRYACCQEVPQSDFMPREFSEEEAVQNIARLRSGLYPKSSIAPILKLQLDVLKSEIDAHRQMTEMLHEKTNVSRVESERLNDIIQNIISTSETNTGVLVDRETTNLLMRNCLVELQRIDWELAAERGLPEQISPNPELEIARLDIEARKAELDAIAARLTLLAEKKDKSTVNSDEVLIEQKAKLKLAESELSKAKLRVDTLANSPSRDAATRVTQLTERKKVLVEQLEALKQQRQVWQKVEPMQTTSAFVRERTDALIDDISQKELEQLRRTTTVDAIESALNATEQQNSEAKPDSDK